MDPNPFRRGTWPPKPYPKYSFTSYLAVINGNKTPIIWGYMSWTKPIKNSCSLGTVVESPHVGMFNCHIFAPQEAQLQQKELEVKKLQAAAAVPWASLRGEGMIYDLGLLMDKLSCWCVQLIQMFMYVYVIYQNLDFVYGLCVWNMYMLDFRRIFLFQSKSHFSLSTGDILIVAGKFPLIIDHFHCHHWYPQRIGHGEAYEPGIGSPAAGLPNQIDVPITVVYTWNRLRLA